MTIIEELEKFEKILIDKYEDATSECIGNRPVNDGWMYTDGFHTRMYHFIREFYQAGLQGKDLDRLIDDDAEDLADILVKECEENKE